MALWSGSLASTCGVCKLSVCCSWLAASAVAGVLSSASSTSTSDSSSSCHRCSNDLDTVTTEAGLGGVY
jgi:hypothetical protein